MDPTILIVVGVYFAVSLSIGFWVARKEKNKADDYFLAGRKLPWYAVAMSMTGSNIGTEHFIGMVGTAYAFGLAPATFEWGNFIPYSILCWYSCHFSFAKSCTLSLSFLSADTHHQRAGCSRLCHCCTWFWACLHRRCMQAGGSFTRWLCSGRSRHSTGGLWAVC